MRSTKTNRRTVNLIRLSEGKSRPEMILPLFLHPTPRHEPVALILAMQSMPQLLGQTLRSSLQLTCAAPVRARFRHAPTAFSVRPTPRSFSVCVQCQFRRQTQRFADFNDRERVSADTERLIREKEKELADLELASRDPVPIPGVEAGSSFEVPPAPESPKSTQSQQEEATPALGEESTRKSGGLPSYLESRRSKWSKQFDTAMDNLQSNVFVAGQRLNDLTGYSSIEALKNEIQFQGMQPDNMRKAHRLIPLGHRGTTPHRSITRQKSERRLHLCDQPSIHVPARSK